MNKRNIPLIQVVLALKKNTMVANYYNFCLPYSSLAEYEGGKPIQITPAMAKKLLEQTGITREARIKKP